MELGEGAPNHNGITRNKYDSLEEKSLSENQAKDQGPKAQEGPKGRPDLHELHEASGQALGVEHW
jgi:hypothetical protein